MKKRNSATITGLIVVAALILAARAADLNVKFSVRDQNMLFMRLKMAYSQGILEGLALEKYDLVTKNAVLLRDMSKNPAWSASKTVPYREHTTNFQHHVDALYLAATDKKLKESTEAYQALIQSCVACHADFRLEQRTEHLKPKAGKP